jgi:hypothetical protein
MPLNSLLASLKSGVAEVAGVQASRSKAITCNPAKLSEVAEVSFDTVTADTATPATSGSVVEVSVKSSSSEACTHETPVTREAISYEAGAGDTSAASRWRLIYCPGRDPVEVDCCPNATHAEILERHPGAVAAEPFTPSMRQPAVPTTAREELAIRAWLELIDETDPAIIAEVLRKCQGDTDARAYFGGRVANDNLQKNRSNGAWDDDRRTCTQCANLLGRRCMAAKRGEIVASRNYEPIRNLPRRCEGYAPRADDADWRHGRERWLGLTHRGDK